MGGGDPCGNGRWRGVNGEGVALLSFQLAFGAQHGQCSGKWSEKNISASNIKTKQKQQSSSEVQQGWGQTKREIIGKPGCFVTQY